MTSNPLNRRELLALSASAALAHLLPRIATAQPTTAPVAPAADHRYRISASDWMMIKRQTPGALDRGKECGLDGVEVDMGPLGSRPDFENKLRDDAFRTSYLAKARELNLALSSLAM